MGSGLAPHAPGDRLPSSFVRVLTAWAASLVGDGVRVVALPLLVVSVQPSPAAVAVVAATTAAPWLLIAVPAGVVVDRVDPARAVAAANVVRFLSAAGLVLAVLTDAVSVPLVALLGFVLTAAETVVDSASQSLVVQLVPTRLFERANARVVTTETVALDLLGPLAGGLLFAVEPVLAFVVCGVCFAVAAGLVVGVRRPAVAAPPAPDTRSSDARSSDALPPDGPAPAVSDPSGSAPPGVWAEVRRGLSALFADRPLRVLVLLVAVLASANAAADGLLVLYGTGVLGLSAAGYPLLLAAYSVGTLAAAAFVGRLTDRYRGGPLMFLAVLGMGGAFVALGLVTEVAAALACYAVLGVAQGTWNVLSASRRQRRTPAGMVARVSSAFRVVAWGTVPLGTLAGGAIAEAWSVPGVFVVAGAGTLLAGVVLGRSLLAAEPAARPWT